MNDRLPPQNVDAERSVLGSMIRDNVVIPDVVLVLRKEDFYMQAHQLLFAAILTLFDASKAIDLVTLHEEMNQRGQLEEIGRAAYLAVLWDAAPTAANVLHYAEIVREKSLLRSLIAAGTEVIRDAYTPTGPASSVLEEAERRILSVSELGVQGQTRSIRDVMGETKARIDARMNKRSGVAIPTGFTDLDNTLVGLHEGELIILAARPSVGKTALSLSIIRHLITRACQPVFFASLEQSRHEIGERLLCAQSGVDGQKLRRGMLSSGDLDAICIASEQLQRGGLLHVDDTACQTVTRIAANARRLQRVAGIRLLLVDYLQLIEPDNPRASKYEQVSSISRRLKHVARDLNIPLLALAQLNRESESRADKRPYISELRDSGSLEQDGDVILLLHRVESRGSVDVVNVIVGKQRNGPRDVEVPLAFCKQSMRFENYSSGENPYASGIPD